MTPETLATDAHWLLDNPTFLRAVAGMRLEALEALADVDSAIPSEVNRLQAQVRACKDLVSTLERFMEAVSD